MGQECMASRHTKPKEESLEQPQTTSSPTHLIPQKDAQPLGGPARGVVPPEGAEPPPVVVDEEAFPFPHRRGLPLGAGAALRGEALGDAEAEEAAPPAVCLCGGGEVGV